MWFTSEIYCFRLLDASGKDAEAYVSRLFLRRDGNAFVKQLKNGFFTWFPRATSCIPLTGDGHFSVFVRFFRGYDRDDDIMSVFCFRKSEFPVGVFETEVLFWVVFTFAACNQCVQCDYQADIPNECFYRHNCLVFYLSFLYLDISRKLICWEWVSVSNGV